MSTVLKRMYSPIAFDCIFGLAGLLGLIGTALSAGRAVPAISAADDPIMKAASLIGVMLFSGLFITQTTRLDQKCADDFVFASLTKSAFMALLAFIVGAALWNSLVSRSLGNFGFHTSIGIAAMLWSATWVWVRWRGTGA